MFRKNNKNGALKTKDSIPSIITQDLHILGNIISDGNVDFDGTLNGNIRCCSLSIRPNGKVTGEVIADHLQVYGHINGLIRAKHVQLFNGCNVEGTIMHETIAIEDGAVVDGKFKRTDRMQIDLKPSDKEGMDDANSSEPLTSMMENIRLIR